MLKSFTALVAFLCLGPADLPPAPSEAPPAALQATAPGLAPEGLTHIFFCPAEAAADPGYTVSMVTGAAEAGALFDPRVRARIELLINKLARRHGVDEKLVRAVLRQESGGDPLAVSPKGAMGLMQLMPDTAGAMGVQNAFNPEDNLAGGVKYLKYCLGRFQQDVALALAAYNAGPGAVEKHQGVPPYRETEHFVSTITRAYTGKPWTREEPAAAAQPEAGVKPAPVPEKTGLNWKVPGPTWKIPQPRPTMAGPRWQGNSPELTQPRPAAPGRYSQFPKRGPGADF
jgi:soluble lytic murein transglycosylase-like protein